MSSFALNYNFFVFDQFDVNVIRLVKQYCNNYVFSNIYTTAKIWKYVVAALQTSTKDEFGFVIIIKIILYP